MTENSDLNFPVSKLYIKTSENSLLIKKLLLLKIEISFSEIISTSCCCAKGPII